ncbi:transposable element Tcb2 transposase [Trichonephila clavipes]|nr:transposable element Tcb2 transposase [Trichonephila clavipes]
METFWSARRVARQLSGSDCVVRRCEDQWIRVMSFTRRPGSGCPRQTSRREVRHIGPLCLLEPYEGLAEGHLGSLRPLRVLPLTPAHRRLRFKWCRARGNWTAAERNQVVFSDESRFNLNSDDNHVRVGRPRGESLNPAFASQQHIAPIAGVMVWGVIAYNTQSSLVLICCTMTAQRCQVIYSQFGLAIHQNDHQARRRFVEWAQNKIAVVPDFYKRILFSDEAHFWLNGYVNKQNCRIWSEANPQVYVETPLHPEKLTVGCALWAGGIIGPYFFKNDEGHNVTVNDDRYRAMITNFFIPELNNHDVQELWFSNKTAQHVTQLVPQSIY